VVTRLNPAFRVVETLVMTGGLLRPVAHSADSVGFETRHPRDRAPSAGAASGG
jgi:hypothetical protein